jgi:hypothetical protein
LCVPTPELQKSVSLGLVTLCKSLGVYAADECLAELRAAEAMLSNDSTTPSVNTWSNGHASPYEIVFAMDTVFRKQPSSDCWVVLMQLLKVILQRRRDPITFVEFDNNARESWESVLVTALRHMSRMPRLKTDSPEFVDIISLAMTDECARTRCVGALLLEQNLNVLESHVERFSNIIVDRISNECRPQNRKLLAGLLYRLVEKFKFGSSDSGSLGRLINAQDVLKQLHPLDVPTTDQNVEITNTQSLYRSFCERVMRNGMNKNPSLRRIQ